MPKIKELSAVRTGSCIFADDIREENTGKEIIIGVYRDAIVLPQLPRKVSRLVLRINIEMPVQDPITKLKVIVEVPGEDKKREFDIGELDTSKKKAQSLQHKYIIGYVIPLEDLSFTKLGQIKVWCITEKDKFIIGRLNVVSAENSKPSINVIPLLMYYKLLSKGMDGEYKEKLAEEVMGFICETSPSIEGKAEALVFQVGINEFKVFFDETLEDGDDLVIHTVPKGLKYKVLEKNKFSAKLQFSTSDEDIEDISIKIKKSK